MTTGTIGSPSGFGGFLAIGNKYYRTWTGGNGRYEPFVGGVRDKWNNYTMSSNARNVTQHQFKAILQNPARSFVTANASWALSFSSIAWDASDQNRLLDKLLKKVKSHEFNLAVSLAQMNQTVDLLSSNLSKLGLAFLDLKHGNFYGAARHLGAKPRPSRLSAKDVSGRWLELQYGWLPLLSDCYEASKAYEAITKKPRAKLFHAVIKKWVPYECSQSPSQYSCKTKLEGRKSILFELYEDMAVARQLGLLDPVSLAWELIPYSFVVDWFVPIGTYLSNINQIPLLKGRYLQSDVKVHNRELEFKWVLVGNWPGNSYPAIVYDTPHVMANYVEFTRTYTGPSINVPRPSFNLGGLSSTRRLLSAISLAHLRLSS